MRIGFVYDAAYPYINGGAERRYHELAKRLAQRHEVHYVTWRYWNGPDEVVEDGVRLHGVGRPPRLYGADGKRTVGEALAFSARLLPVLLRQRWDVIDCSATPYLPLYSASLASKWTRTSLVATWHEFWGERWHDYLPHRRSVASAASRIEGGSRRLGDRVVAVSRFTAGRMGLADDSERLRIVGNGVSLAEIAAVDAAPQRIDLVYVGRLIDEKRVDVLLDAMHLLAGRLPRLRCAIVGDGPERPALERRAHELGLSRRVQFLGYLEGREAIGVMKSARSLVLPSIREGFGMTVLEAQACGAVPIVVRSPWSAATDLIDPGVNGLVCDATSSSLADAVWDFMADRVRQRAMSMAAQRSASTFDWDALADRMEEIYLELVETAGARVATRRLRWS